jgi:hypothetical protein
VSTIVPLQNGGNMGFFVPVDGYQPAADEEMRVEMAVATGDFFRTLGVPLLGGRDIDPATSAGDEPQVVVNRTMAEAYWGGRDPLAGVVRLREQGLRVVGVTGDAAWRAVPQPPLNFLAVPLTQFPGFATSLPLTLAVRTTGDPAALLPALRREALAVEPNLTFHFLQTMEGLLGAALTPQRMGALLLTAFGALALILAAVGIGGVVAYMVGRQRREIGIRIALGATRARVQRGVLSGVMVPVAAGAALGVLAAVALGRTVQDFLVEVSAADPWTYAAALSVLLGVAVLAAWVPALRATRVDPSVVLRQD